MKKKKITFVIQQLKRAGGTEMVSVELARAFLEVFDVRLIVIQEINSIFNSFNLDPRLELTSLNVKEKYMHLDEYIDGCLKSHRYFHLIFRALQVGLFWSYHIFSFRHQLRKMTSKDEIIFLTALDSYALAPKKRKIVFHYHFDEQHFVKKSFQCFLKIVHKPLKFIVLSKSIKDNIIVKLPKYKDLLEVKYNFIRFERTHDLSFHQNRIIFVGRLEEQKNPLALVTIMKRISETDINCHLDIFGQGTLKDKLQKQIKLKGLDNLITIHDFSSQIDKEFEKSDILLLPSIYEGFPLVLIEGAAKSNALVASEFGPNVHEIIKDSVNGYIGTTEGEIIKKLILLLTDRELLLKMKENAYQMAEPFSKEVIMDDFIKFIESI